MRQPSRIFQLSNFTIEFLKKPEEKKAKKTSHALLAYHLLIDMVQFIWMSSSSNAKAINFL